VSRHWNPDGEPARAFRVRERKSWPAGATAGLLLVAAACVGVAVVLYQVAGPRDAFEDGAAPE
jgi:hypothetical protein